MPRSEFPLSVLFVIFLLLFLLAGILPAWKQVADKIRRLRKQSASDRSAEPPSVRSTEFTPTLGSSQPLSDYERFIIWRLVQSPDKGFSRKRICADLHFEAGIVKQALKSLLGRGLVMPSLSPLFGIRYRLSEQGRHSAAEEGFLLELDLN